MILGNVGLATGLSSLAAIPPPPERKGSATK
jgi:hypothetical protein